MDGTLVLAERRLVVERDGRPRTAGNRAAARPSAMEQRGRRRRLCHRDQGLAEEMPPVRGRDFFDVLVKAARTLRAYCRTPPQGIRFFYLGEPPYDREPYEGEPLDSKALAADQKNREDIHRKDWEVLVERKILMQRDGSDERQEVVLQVGRPYRMPVGNQAACPIALRGAGEDEIEHRYGRDTFEALSNAVREINERSSGPQCGRFFFWPDGEKRRRMTIKIGYPYWVKDGEQASCPMELAGLYGDVGPAPGDDLYSALIFALDFFNTLGRSELDTRFFWPDGTPYMGEPLDREPEPTT